MSLEDIIAPEMVEEARRHVGENLRLVGSYYEHNFETLYVRSDIVERFSEEKQKQIFRDFLMEALAAPISEQIYGEAPRCQIEVVGEAVIFHFHINEVSGHVISVDSSSFSDLHDFIDACESYTTTETSY